MELWNSASLRSAPLRGSRLNPPWWITRSTQNILEGVKGPFDVALYWLALRMRKWRWRRLSTYNIWQSYWILLDTLRQSGPAISKIPLFSTAKRRFIGHGPHLPGHRFSIFFLIPASSNCQSTKHPLTTPWLSGKKTKKHMFWFHSQSLWGDLTSHMYTR